MIDLLEIYHGRQIQNALSEQLRRLSAADQHLSVGELARKREIARFYRAMSETMAEYLVQLGDLQAVAERR